MEQDRQTPGTFYHRPGQQPDGEPIPYAPHEPEEPANSLARAAMVLGVISVISFFTFTIYPAVIFGSLAIILALLSRGASFKMHSKAKNAVITAAIAIGCDIALVIGCCFLILGSADFFESMYGMSFEEMMEGMENGTLDYDELYENIYNNMYENMYEDMHGDSPEELPEDIESILEGLPEDRQEHFKEILEELQ